MNNKSKQPLSPEQGPESPFPEKTPAIFSLFMVAQRAVPELPGSAHPGASYGSIPQVRGKVYNFFVNNGF